MLPPKSDAARQSWKCDMCRSCSVCKRGEPIQKLLSCDDCGILTHSSCLRIPPPPSTVKTKWLCSNCVACQKCGRKTPGDAPGTYWMFDSSLCFDCGQLRLKQNFCPVCEVLYRDDDDHLKMVCCNSCDRWIHASCEGISDELYEQLNDPDMHDVEYNCKECAKALGGGDAASLADQTKKTKAEVEAAMEAERMLILYSYVQQVFQYVRGLQKCWAFEPQYDDRSTLPGFHDVIPVDEDITFEHIDLKIARREYTCTNDFVADFERCCSNRLRYHTHAQDTHPYQCAHQHTKHP